MSEPLPKLVYQDLAPTRDYLQEVALVLSSLQRGFLTKHPRQWQYGLEVTMRGLGTQPCIVNGEEMRAGLDLIRHKVRLDGQKWGLHETTAPEILNDFRNWLTTKGVTATLQEPKFKDGVMLYDTSQVEAYAQALWWMDEQFRVLKTQLVEGLTSPILLYPHHFDLALTWFPFDDERQLSLGWSTGDKTITEPYIYLTAYPELTGFTDIVLPTEAYWQTENFSGAILPYAALQVSHQPEELFKRFAGDTFTAARRLYT